MYFHLHIKINNIRNNSQINIKKKQIKNKLTMAKDQKPAETKRPRERGNQERPDQPKSRERVTNEDQTK